MEALSRLGFYGRFLWLILPGELITAAAAAIIIYCAASAGEMFLGKQFGVLSKLIIIAGALRAAVYSFLLIYEWGSLGIINGLLSVFIGAAMIAYSLVYSRMIKGKRSYKPIMISGIILGFGICVYCAPALIFYGLIAFH